MYNSVQRAIDLLDTPATDGATIKEAFSNYDIAIDVTTIETDAGSTDFISFEIDGTDRTAPTQGIVGRLGGVGARPQKTGIVSDADGAIIAIAAAFELARMHERGDTVPGDVIVSTHVCPDAPIIPHEPVPFMSSPVDIATMNEHEIDDRMDAILSIDATKGTRVHCQRGFAITPTVKEGWILRTSEALLDIQERVSGEPPVTLTLSTQDITPYGNDVFHINSILQPSTATDAPVVGVATTSVNPVAGSGTGANYLPDLASATSFVVETAKSYTNDQVSFYDVEEYNRLTDLYGSMSQLQTLGDEE